MGNKNTLFGFIFTFVALIFLIIAFSSPYWLESYANVHSDFVRLGLWEACFDGYVHPQDYNSKVYRGCWWIFSPEYRPIWEWLDPPWFIGCQVLVVLLLLTQIGNTFIVTMNHLRCCSPGQAFALNMLTGILSMVNCTLTSLIALVFGVKSEDRIWMPRPDQNYLSWSYGVFVLSAFSCLFAGLFLFGAAQDARKYYGRKRAPQEGVPMAPRLQ